MTLLYGTTNPAKLKSMRKWLAPLRLDVIGLNDLNHSIPIVSETGTTPLENAREKAFCYYQAYQIPVFSCDSGLTFENVPAEIQPGLHVRNVHGRKLSDDEMIEYYRGLAKTYGPLTARYKNAICLVMDSQHVYESMDDSLSGSRFRIIDKPHPRRKAGFPLDSLSVHLSDGAYFFDTPDREVDDWAMDQGFLAFFRNSLDNARA